MAYVFVAACDVSTSNESDERWHLTSEPAASDNPVPRPRVVKVSLDRRVLPRTVSDSNVRVRSGGYRVAGTVSYDVVEPAIHFTPADDEVFEPGVRYVIAVSDLLDLDGVVLPEPFEATFLAGEDTQPPPSAERLLGYRDVEPVFRKHCATSECHDSATQRAGLDLSSGPMIVATAVGVPAQSSPGGTTGLEGARGALTLSGLPIIDIAAGRGRPETSALIYKLMADEHVLGEPMPPGPQRLDVDDIERVAAWIRAGAPTE